MPFTRVTHEGIGLRFESHWYVARVCLHKKIIRLVTSRDDFFLQFLVELQDFWELCHHTGWW